MSRLALPWGMMTHQDTSLGFDGCSTLGHREARARPPFGAACPVAGIRLPLLYTLVEMGDGEFFTLPM